MLDFRKMLRTYYMDDSIKLRGRSLKAVMPYQKSCVITLIFIAELQYPI